MSRRQPIFNAPLSAVLLIAVFVAVHAALNLLPYNMLSQKAVNWTIWALAFVPARYGADADLVPGGSWSAIASWLTHAFVHGNLMHLVINSAWMLAFGSAIARRIGAARFLAFSGFCAIAGAAAFLFGNQSEVIPMVGASGAIAGLMGGTMRFLFSALGGPRPRDLHDNIAQVPRMSLAEAAKDRRIILASLAWVIINLAMGYGASAITSAGGIAWEAHIGGYFAGLLAFGAFDRGRSKPYDETDYARAAGLRLDDEADVDPGDRLH